jgi:L-asparaginase II
MFELTRGQVVESVHFGAAVVVDVSGKLVAWYGDPQTVTYLRSSAKPFQALPFIEHGGQAHFGLSQREVAVMCASHSGTDAHVEVVQSLQRKAGVQEAELLCGVHQPTHEPTAETLKFRGEEPTPNRHNCSGKHSGMLAYVRMLGRPARDHLQYIDPSHPIQSQILQTFSEICAIPVERVALGIDGCSAPIFAVPLYHAALGYARLSDPQHGGAISAERQAACQTVVSAMTAHPDMVGGPGRFDTRLMEVARGRLVSKGGAEGYQAIGLLPGALGAGSPGLGIVLKVSDGDARKRAVAAASLEVLRQLGALTSEELEALADLGPCFPVHNWRKIVVGQARPAFVLQRAE